MRLMQFAQFFDPPALQQLPSYFPDSLLLSKSLSLRFRPVRRHRKTFPASDAGSVPVPPYLCLSLSDEPDRRPLSSRASARLPRQRWPTSHSPVGSSDETSVGSAQAAPVTISRAATAA